MLAWDMTPGTLVVGLAVLALAALAVRRLWRNGTCDHGKDDPRGAGSRCSGGCAGCAGCGAADRMVADLQKQAAAEARR